MFSIFLYSEKGKCKNQVNIFRQVYTFQLMYTYFSVRDYIKKNVLTYYFLFTPYFTLKNV